MESLANESGLLPEQTWDSPDIPEKDLYFGRPAGSAMPLVWVHGEYVKLRRSLHDGRVFDTPHQSVERYLKKKTISPLILWNPDQPCRALPAGKTLRLELTSPAQVHWSSDGWKTTKNASTRDTGLGVYFVDLPTEKLVVGNEVVFTFDWQDSTRQDEQKIQRRGDGDGRAAARASGRPFRERSEGSRTAESAERKKRTRKRSPREKTKSNGSKQAYRFF